MDDAEFDRLMIQAAFSQAGLRGWSDLSLAEAAREAGLDLARARTRFPSRSVLLLRFGAHADATALASASATGTPRERLFDLVMSRFDVLQANRDGIVALLVALRTDPATALMLYGLTLRSMRWLLEAAGIPATGLTGALRVHGAMALWLYALRAWERDDSADLAGTMAAVDRGLDRAIQAERSLPGGGPPDPEPDVTVLQT